MDTASVSGNCLVHPVCLLILFFQMMREMGNSRARAIYEAKLPDNFRRPQSDSALETFIRSKYEQKRYIAPNYVPIKPDVDGLAKVHTFSSVEKCTVFHPDHLFYWRRFSGLNELPLLTCWNRIYFYSTPGLKLMITGLPSSVSPQAYGHSLSALTICIIWPWPLIFALGNGPMSPGSLSHQSYGDQVHTHRGP